MIDIECRCGETYHADESHAGRSVRCPKCGMVTKIERSSRVQSTFPSRTEAASIPNTEGRPAKRVSRSTFGLSRRMKAAILAGVVFGVFGIAVALDKLWPDSPSKPGVESSATVAQPVAPTATTQSHDIQLPVVEPSPVIPNLLRQNATLPPAQSSSDDLASLSTTNGEVQQIPISPCARGQQVERPQTGMRIEPDEGGSGESQLKISNGTDRDAAVRLLSQETGTTARFVYINAGGQYTLGNIVPGTYLLRFSSGHDWVSACRDFLDPEYSEFERTLVFEDVVLNDGQERYNVMEITLNPVPFGNATTRTIDRKRFFEGDRHVKLIP